MVLKKSPALISPSFGFITPFPTNAFPNILTANVPSYIERNPVFCILTSFLIVSLISCISTLDSSSGLATLLISSISSLEIVNGAVPDPKMFF